MERSPSESASNNNRPQLDLFELLDIDDRPTLVFDLTNPHGIPTYHNASLEKIPLLGLKLGTGVLSNSASSKDQEYAAFIEWAAESEGQLAQWSYCGLLWSSHILRDQWKIVLGSEGHEHDYISARRRQSEAPKLGRARTSAIKRPSHSPSQSQIKSMSDGSLEAQIAALRLRDRRPLATPATDTSVISESIQNLKVMKRLDFLGVFPAIASTPHHKFFMEFDWASTGLGPIDSWTINLRRAVYFLFSDPRPAALYWGGQRTMMYNESYMHLAGQKHPGIMGKTFSEAWGDVASDLDPAFKKAYSTGEATVHDDALFYIERNGYLEESYFSLAIIPFLGDKITTGEQSFEKSEIAFYNPAFDTTRQVIAERRMTFLLLTSNLMSSSRNQREFWHQLIVTLQPDHPDVKFAVIYSVNLDASESGSEASDLSHNRHWTLQGKIRFENSTPGIPIAATEQSMERFLPKFSDLVRSESQTLLRTEDGSLPESIARDKSAKNGEFVQTAVFLPIRSTADTLLGFLIIGLNNRKNYDRDYQVFIELLTRQLATSLASAVLFEEELRQAARDHKLLTKKLAIQTHEALETETRFRRMADLAPVGIYHIEPSGLMLYCNENYYELTDHPRDKFAPMSWLNVLFEDDLPHMAQEWAKLLSGEAVNFEIRLRRPFIAEDVIDGEQVEGYTWILAAAYPERSSDGIVLGILGCITDISRQKWMEGFQKRKMLEAVELKRQQENFIDMTSHEMRNPLSAIVQCADWIGGSLDKFECDKNNVVIPRDVIEGYVEATDTIVLCAQHQKRIIDDVLTLSKLDSDLLAIAPIDVQLAPTIRKSLKMFDVELQNHDISLGFEVDYTYSNLAVDWVKLDPSRLLQILINLVTNAIKFTTTESTRNIVIKLAASLDPPDNSTIEYLPRINSARDSTNGSAWGTGEYIYFNIEVQDSGRGLDEVERTLLFKRFSQTSPRTHVQYGGSGLGLFICRQLTELQGGQIGVTSSAGSGSTFAFYVRARRCESPQGATPTPPIDSLLIPRDVHPKLVAKSRTRPPQEMKLSVPRHVLIVEDNIVNQKVLSRQLKSAGCIVSVANHGREALSYLEKSRFWKGLETAGNDLSVILMDLEMPIMDGLTCVKVIRQLQDEGKIVGHVPVIAVTANARSEQISNARESGMDSVVTKPFRIPDLLPEIDKQIGISSMRGLERSALSPA
ncbi:related to sensory transduction histidine kinase [Rhynchosporium agropyri]|uniref:Related to sensory transduction histidine kinase n=1 Tax=Rhynchosporium agropyri TaxID=914238 RepID=A0A1E1L1Y0_9HELO|nr:related to sensory transduction histidine kinase [Rhynchosporium agropyri]